MENLRLWIVNALVAIYLVTFVLSALPPTAYLPLSQKGGALAWAQPLGWSQQWPMFAPDPGSYNFKQSVHFVFADGTSRDWDLETYAASLHDELARLRWRRAIHRMKLQTYNYEPFVEGLRKRLGFSQHGAAEMYIHVQRIPSFDFVGPILGQSHLVYRTTF